MRISVCLLWLFWGVLCGGEEGGLRIWVGLGLSETVFGVKGVGCFLFINLGPCHPSALLPPHRPSSDTPPSRLLRQRPTLHQPRTPTQGQSKPLISFPAWFLRCFGGHQLSGQSATSPFRAPRCSYNAVAAGFGAWMSVAGASQLQPPKGQTSRTPPHYRGCSS